MNEIKFDSDSFKRAMAKATEKKPMVRPGKPHGVYFVAASDGVSAYCVSFTLGGGGRRLSSCLCAGGMKGLFCYHQAAALIVHVAYVRAGIRQPATVRTNHYRGSESVRNLI